MLRRAFSNFTPATFAKLFATTIRPTLEYCAPAWAPCSKKNAWHLERVQRAGSKHVRGLGHLSYEDRLRSMNLFSLSYRRRRGDLITLFRILSGLCGDELRNLFKYNSRSGRRGHSRVLLQPRCDSLQTAILFSARTIPHWNRLSDWVVSAPSITTFKSRLDKVLDCTL